MFIWRQLTECISEAGSAIDSVRPFVRPFISALTLELSDLCMLMGHDHSSSGIEDQGQMSKCIWGTSSEGNSSLVYNRAQDDQQLLL